MSSICPSCQGGLENGVCVTCLLAVGLDEDGVDAAELDFSDIPDGACRLGGYELLGEIGRGGMGVIYQARQPFSNRLVALKRLLPAQNTSPETALRLRREAEAVASLDHPHILPVYEVGADEEGLPFFSMKLAAGGSLAENRKRLAGQSREIAGLLVKIARAVAYAHDRGILHRDLKPGNILLDGNGEPLVADFGLAKWLDRPSDLTLSLTVFGTPGYLAPEQASGSVKDLGPATDIYSLGAILFDLLTGRPPFIGENAWSVVQRAAHEKAPLLRSLQPALDRDLETICARCLEREPDARYKKASDLADDLQRWLDGRPILARPVSLPEMAWRWARRNRWLTVTALFCLGAAFWGLGHLAESRRLGHLVEVQNQSAHAIRLLPIFDMDAASYRSPAAAAATGAIEGAIRDGGRILKTASPGAAWTRDFAAEARDTGAPYLIAGTTRQTSAGQKIVLHWFDAREGRFTRRMSGITKDDPAPLLKWLGGELLAGRGDLIPELNSEWISGNQEARDLIVSGEQYYSRQTVEGLEQAIFCGRKALQKDPKSARAYTLLGQALMRRSWYGSNNQSIYQEEAKKVMEKAVEIAPESAFVYEAKASVAFLAGHLEEAENAIRTYLELSMNVANASAMSGSIAKLYGRSDQALVWFRLRSTFDHRENTVNLEADVLADLGLDREASVAYAKFADLFPDRPDGRLGLCELKLLTGEFSEARQMSEDLASDFPNQVYPILIAGQEAFYARDYARAAELYGKLMETDRAGGSFFYGSISFLSGTGFSLLSLGKKDEGIRLLQEAQKNDKELLQTEHSQLDHLNSLAATEAALGNNEEALKILQDNLAAMSTTHRFIERDPRFDSLRKNLRFQEILRAMKERMDSLKRQVAAGNAPPVKL